ncbi:MAG: hypothetical protein ACT4N2_02985 [Hyphomicrobium sp.]
MKTILRYALVASVSLALAPIEVLAQGKSGNSNGNGRAVGNPHNSGSGARANGPGSGNSSNTPASPTDPSAGQSGGDGLAFDGEARADSLGTYGQVGTYYVAPLGNSLFLQLDGGFDLDQRSADQPAGEASGRVGLGWQY